jgi:hypothetical protein
VNAALPDAFETAEDSDGEGNVEVTRASIELDDLPIELITLTDKQVQPASSAYGSSNMIDLASSNR